MDITTFDTLIIDCDGILVNHYQGILNKIYELQKNLPQDIPYQESVIHQYLKHYYNLSDSIYENGFCVTHCFSFQTLMNELKATSNWKHTFQFGRAVNQWPMYEDAYGALHYLKKFYRVLIRCDREPEDIPQIIKSLAITEHELIIREHFDSDLSNTIRSLGLNTHTTLLLTTPHLAELTQFPNTRVIHRSAVFLPENANRESLAKFVLEHQTALRSSWH
ncbi:hypothetical protein OAP63_05945 [Vibrio sp.]|nr:hypothetical protein [Vibrio sp.]